MTCLNRTDVFSGQKALERSQTLQWLWFLNVFFWIITFYFLYFESVSMLSGHSYGPQTQTWWCSHVGPDLSHPALSLYWCVCVLVWSVLCLCVTCVYASTWVTPGSQRCWSVPAAQIRWFPDSAGLSGPPGCSPDSAQLGTDTGTAPVGAKTQLKNWTIFYYEKYPLPAHNKRNVLKLILGECLR